MKLFNELIELEKFIKFFLQDNSSNKFKEVH